MNQDSRKVQRVYLLLLFLQTVAASLIWGINTLFLLDAGLTNTEAFTANAFFTAGMTIFEVPTGVVADTRGRRTSYLLGTVTLTVATLAYFGMWYLSVPFWGWAVVSLFLGLGFTFFSGAVEAWLVDGLATARYFEEGGTLESALARGEIVEGVGMLSGSIAGGLIAQATNLGIPYLIRAVVLALTFVVAFSMMRDIGFEPRRDKRIVDEVKNVLRSSIDNGLKNPPVRWVMLSAPFTGGVMIYAFYAMQPYLLELYGSQDAYSIAGLAAAAFAGAQIAGGLLVPYVRRVVRKRTTVLLVGTSLSAGLLALMGLLPNFWSVLVALVLWGLAMAAITPVRQTYLNGLIASEQRATVLSFDSLMQSVGAVGVQPPLGRIADVWGYPASYLCTAGVQVLAIPFLLLARRERASSDVIQPEGEQARVVG
ncbi:MAG: MFS transporter [Gemmatimonas sp.]|nr:MFS transporter [Gemmatimonas sp.]